MIHAILMGDLGIHLTKGLFDEPAKSVVSIISVDNSSFECEGNIPAANNEESFSSYDEWEKYLFVDIYDYFDCRTHARNKHKTLYTTKMWAKIRKAFAAQAGVGVSLLIIHDNGSDYYSDYAEGKGQDVFVARDFSKG